jgi:aspartate/methionine/tyrosine aminotransferase
VKDFLSSQPKLEWVDPDGGTVVFPRIRGVRDTREFAETLLRDHDTAVVPGHFFQAPDHIRIGFGGQTPSLRGGLAELGKALASL